MPSSLGIFQHGSDRPVLHNGLKYYISRNFYEIYSKLKLINIIQGGVTLKLQLTLISFIRVEDKCVF